MRIPLLGFLLLIAPAAWANTIYTTGSVLTDPLADCSSACPELTSFYGQGLFTLTGSATISEIDFTTFQLPGVYHNGTLDWSIYTDDAGAPGTQLSSGAFTLNQNDMSDDIHVAGYGPLIEYMNTFTVSDLTINPSPQPGSYFLDIHDPSTADQFGIFWATSGQNTLAFQIDGIYNPAAQTPEPSTVVLIAGGLAYLVGRRVWLQKTPKS